MTTQTVHQTMLYRGGKVTTYKALIENGFDLSKLGVNFGQTLGPGIYLSPSKEEALGYSENGKTIIEVPVENLNSFKLERAFSVDSKNDRKNLKKITQRAKEHGYNALNSVCGNETVVFEEFSNLILWELGEIVAVIQP
jgi:hypothetical protein